MLIHLLPLLASALFVNAQGAGTSFSPTPVTTAVATATVAADTPVAGQGDYPPPQRTLWLMREELMELSLV